LNPYTAIKTNNPLSLRERARERGYKKAVIFLPFRKRQVLGQW
jgi:hypothetical protein